MRLREGEQVATLAPVVGSDEEPETDEPEAEVEVGLGARDCRRRRVRRLSRQRPAVPVPQTGESMRPWFAQRHPGGVTLPGYGRRLRHPATAPRLLVVGVARGARDALRGRAGARPAPARLSAERRWLDERHRRHRHAGAPHRPGGRAGRPGRPGGRQASRRSDATRRAALPVAQPRPRGADRRSPRRLHLSPPVAGGTRGRSGTHRRRSGRRAGRAGCSAGHAGGCTCRGRGDGTGRAGRESGCSAGRRAGAHAVNPSFSPLGCAGARDASPFSRLPSRDAPLARGHGSVARYGRCGARGAARLLGDYDQARLRPSSPATRRDAGVASGECAERCRRRRSRARRAAPGAVTPTLCAAADGPRPSAPREARGGCDEPARSRQRRSSSLALVACGRGLPSRPHDAYRRSRLVSHARSDGSRRPARVPGRDLRGVRVERNPRLLRGTRRGHPPGSTRTGSKAPTRHWLPGRCRFHSLRSSGLASARTR